MNGMSYYLGTIDRVDRSKAYPTMQAAAEAEKQMRQEQGDKYEQHYVYYTWDSKEDGIEQTKKVVEAEKRLKNAKKIYA